MALQDNAALGDPGYAYRTVTPHAVNALPDGVCRGLITDGGNVNLTDASGTTVVVPTVAGVEVWVRATHVKIASTTATTIVAIY
jgi:hypothetical protein